MGDYLGFYKKENRVYLYLFIIGVVTRLPFLERYQTHWDGPDYTLAIINYSFVEKTPTEPGYPLYIAMGKLFHLIVPDIHYSILAVSVLFAGIGAAVAYGVGKTIFNKKIGLISSALFLSAPTFYYFGITANPYGLLFTTSSLLALATYLIVAKSKNLGFILGVAMAFAIGVRPQDLMLLLILFLVGFINLNFKEKIKSIISTAFLFLVWFLPTALAVGGIKVYLSYVINFFNSGPGVNLTYSRVREIAPILIKGLYQTFTFASAGLIYFLKPIKVFLNEEKKNLKKNNSLIVLVFASWILPPLVFNVFVRSDHAAHQVAYLSGFLYLISFSLGKLFSQKSKILLLVVTLLILFNLYTFFRVRDVSMTLPYVSQSYHYSEIIKNNIRTPAIIGFVKQFDPDEVIVITDPEIFRQTSYYLSNFRVYAYSALDTRDLKIKDTVHYAYGLHYLFSVNKSNSILINGNIKKIILIPNNKPFKFNYKIQKIKLSGNSFLYVLPVRYGEQYKFMVRSIEKLN